jgi:arylsulfatase A-like enzyme
LLCALVAGLSGCGGGSGPNLLLVSVDTLRADHLGCYGYERPTSPQLDALARRGLRFARATSVVPTTLASHTTMLTGLLPYQSGVARNGFVVPEEIPTLAEILVRRGYATAGFVSSYVLSREFGIARGFAHFDDALPERTTMVQHKTVRGSRATTDAALAWIGSAREPFFAFVHYFDPHWPYEPPAEAPDFDPDYTGSMSGSQAEIRLLRERLLASGGRPDRDVRHLVALYDAEIATVDAQLGRLWAALEQSGRAARTVVVVTADHGESFWEHDEFIDHGAGVYAATLHVPLLILAPGAPRAATVERPVSTLDLFPTLCALAGAEPELPVEGVSLVPLLSDPTAPLPQRRLFAEATKPPPLGGGASAASDLARWPNLPFMKTLQSDGLRYVLTPPSGREELYDLGADPEELVDLSRRPEQRERLAALREAMAERIESIRADARPARNLVDPDTRERLRSLGYTQ